MSGINKVILIGNLGGKPELKYTSSGLPVANFTVAVTEAYGKSETGEKKEITEWVKIVAWRKLAEICAQYLDKGSKVYVEGKLRSSSWTTPEGEKRYKTEVHIDEMCMLGGKAKGDGYDTEYPTEPAAKGRVKPHMTANQAEVINLDLLPDIDEDQSKYL